ncbi:MAG: hypothetical protein QN128_07745 [Armatimonadota bacterium]|nr:hypothetical protein [Armatimonadota bacterium]
MSEALVYIAARVAVGDAAVVRAALMVAEGEMVPAAAREVGATKWQVRKLYDMLRALAVLNTPSLPALRAAVDELERLMREDGVKPRGDACPFCGYRAASKRSLLFHLHTSHRDRLERLVEKLSPAAAAAAPSPARAR